MNPRLGVICLLVATAPGAATGAEQEDPPAPGPGAPITRVDVAPQQLVTRVGRLLGEEFAVGEVPWRTSDGAARAAAARRWQVEAFAVLDDPACAPVLRAAGIPPGANPAPGAAWPEARPIAAAPAGDVLLLPPEVPLVTTDDAARLRATGLLPFEIALAGEYARVVGARHAGPAPRDPLLRLARLARLEGTARLAGITLALRGANLDPRVLGVATLSADRDESGLPRAVVAPAVSDPVRSALIETALEDGFRWALYQYLRGGLTGVLAALERPGGSPAELLRPGLARVPAALPAGCRVGPRASAALLTGATDTPWVDALLADAWSIEKGAALAALAFEDDRSAARAGDELRRGGWEVRQEGPVLRVKRAVRGEGRVAKP